MIISLVEVLIIKDLREEMVNKALIIKNPSPDGDRYTKWLQYGCGGLLPVIWFFR